jgi:2-iminobutanoate/2-iminopropanoate deaminase
VRHCFSMKFGRSADGYSESCEIAGPARLLFISGQVPLREDGTVPEGFESQCLQVWNNLESVLHEAGMTLHHLVKVTTYLSDRTYRDQNSGIRREILGSHEPVLTVVIAGIYDEAWLLEIEAVAAIPI